jgi:hypothetical protein
LTEAPAPEPSMAACSTTPLSLRRPAGQVRIWYADEMLMLVA